LSEDPGVEEPVVTTPVEEGDDSPSASRGGSIANPLFGIDIASHQQGLDIEQVARLGYDFVIAKSTEGPYRDGSTYTNPLFKKQISATRANGMVPGTYHFLVETPAKAQADHFLKTIGDDIEGMLLAIDFEAYNAPYGYLTPANGTLEDFVDYLRARVGKHPIILYSGRGFWNGCDLISTSIGLSRRQDCPPYRKVPPGVDHAAPLLPPTLSRRALRRMKEWALWPHAPM
jgi:hypothetical protein